MTRLSRLLVGAVAAVAIAGTAPWLAGAATASQSTPPSGDDRATSVSGNAVTCADVGFAGDTQLGSDNSAGASGDGFTVTSDSQYLTLTAIPDGTTIDALIVKGGDAYNQYGTGSLTAGASGFHAPLVGGDKNVPTISHWFLCYKPADSQPPALTPPSVSTSGNCSSADVVLNAGSSDTTFVVTRSGDAGVSYPVSAGQSQTVHVGLDSTHPSVSVTVNGQPLGDTFTRSADCDTNNGGGGDNGGGGGNTGGGNNTGGGSTPPGGPTPPGGGTTTGGSTSSGGTAAPVANPAVSATKACRSGITVTLTNLGGNAPVTFTLTAPSGSTSTLTLQPNQSATRTFAVAEDTTGHVTASAPGLTRTFTYHKDCTQVLGVKHVRQPKPQGAKVPSGGTKTSAAALPFTGFAAGSITLDGLMLLTLGGLACRFGRRRQAQRAR